MKPCCTPARPDTLATPPALQQNRPVTDGPAIDWLMIPGGRFLMGTDSTEGFAEDGEGPAREVTVRAFQIGRTAVTNAQFRDFVRATRYVTQAEQAGWSFVFYLQLPPERRRVARQVARDVPWWLPVDAACWQRPHGPGSSVLDRLDHPVVHMSWHDAAAYGAWAGARLPTEAEWELAARGGLSERRYPWGDELAPEGRGQCHIWHGDFPAHPAAGWAPNTIAADALPPNGYGLHNVVGNAWEWCADWFDPHYHRCTPTCDPLQQRPTGRRAQRGGSFLCHASYCNRYRVAARGANTPDSSTSHCGFRVARTLS